MDTHSKLLLGNQLYQLEIIEKFGKRHPKWYIMSGREKESHLLHVMLCILLCNQERIEKTAGEKRKIKEVGCTGEQHEAKRLKFDPNQPSTSKGLVPTGKKAPSTSSSTNSSETTEDVSAMEGTRDLPLKDYRFKMINHMPMKDATTKEICKEWGIAKVSYQWDLVDIENKKFVRLRYSYNPGEDFHKYLRAKSEVPNNCDMYLIESGETKGRWIERNKEALGESKITKFLVERTMVLNNLGINDNLYMPPVSLDTIFPSSWLKEEMGKWEEDLLKDQHNTYSEAQLYAKESPPNTITPLH